MSIPLYEQLYNHLTNMIRTGKLAPGDRVPSEKELADQFSVSRITSKKAMAMLEQAGVIDRIQGKGSFVRADAAPPAARILTDNPRLIGVVIPDFSDAYALKMIYAIEETCAHHDLFVVIKRSYGVQDEEKAAIQGLLTVGVAGLIVFPVHGEFYNPELLRLVIGGFPIVLVDRHLHGIPASAVYTDNVGASAALTRHLLDNGHSRIAFISPPARYTSTIEERIEGYRAALTQYDVTFTTDRVLATLISTLPTAFNEAHARRDAAALRAFFTAHVDLDAVIASEYNVALLVSEVLRSMGRELPVVCFDSPENPLVPPRFTHIRQNERRIGERAVEILLTHIAGQTETQIAIIDFEFVQPVSTFLLTD